MTENNIESGIDRIMSERLAKAQKLRELAQNPYDNKFEVGVSVSEFDNKYNIVFLLNHRLYF